MHSRYIGQSLIIFLVFCYSGCGTEESHQVCGVDDPLTELTWLNDIKTSFEVRMSIAGAQIIQYQYEGNYVFWIEDPCCNNENPQAIVYNCIGEIIYDFRDAERSVYMSFIESATDSTMLLNYVNE